MSIDPLAALAETQTQLHDRLLELTPAADPDLQAAWQAAAEACLDPSLSSAVNPGPSQYLILITCRDERHQVELLTRLQAQGLDCRALLA